MTEENPSEERAEEIIRQFNENKANIHTFFTNVVKSKDTTKTGNLSSEELGMSNLPERTYKELSLFSNDIADQTYWGDYFEKMGEIQTATSLSKEGFLMKLAVTSKKELADMTPRKVNKSWFKKKDTGEQT
jgi:hypothetical protein